MKTKQGIYIDIKESDIKVVKYGLVFYFSSEFYKTKFIENVDNYINQEMLKLKNKYKINNNFELFLTLSYYKYVEKRGFKVLDDVNKKEVTENVLLINQILCY